jgi:hypothetical protein
MRYTYQTLTKERFMPLARKSTVPNIPNPPAPPIVPEHNVDFKSSQFCSVQFPYVPRTLENVCVPLMQVKPDPKNPRRNDKAAKQLAKLIKQYGFRKPIVLDQDNMIRAGHTAYKAAMILNMTHIPAVVSEFDSRQSVGYLVSDNASGEYSDWDTDLLVELMKSGELDSREMSGFSERKWKGLQLSDDLPAPLMEVDIKGDSAETGDFLIIRFPHSQALSRFKAAFGMGKTERALDIKRLSEGHTQLKDFDYDSF